ncbi:MAG: methylmalonyl-CoA epimerase [Saprospiraceae bacterium]|nr:methylmalonyl-CoA epimerase [Saprospiraceae bacterium]
MLQVKDFPLDHIGIAVKDLNQATERFRKLAEFMILAEEEVPSQQVVVRFLQHGEFKIELLKSTTPQSTIARFIDKRGEGIHHVAFRVKQIDHEMRRLREEGLEIIQDKPILGAMNKWIFFIHPRSMGGTLVEICQPVTQEK